MHARTWSKTFTEAIEKAELEAGTLHWLRHTSISRSCNNGVAIHMVQKWTGHAKIETTLGYLHISEDCEYLEINKIH